MQTHTYRDFDAFTHHVRDVDCVMMLQNPKRRLWSIDHVYLPGAHIQLGRLGSGNIVEGQSWPNGFLVYLPLSEACPYKANGTVFGNDSFMILEPGCEFNIITRDEHDWCSVFVPTEKVELRGDATAPPLSYSEKSTCRVTRVDHKTVQRFRALVDQVMTAGAECAQFEASPAARHAAAEAAAVVSSIVGRRQVAQPIREGRPRIAREDIVRRCKQLLEERDGERLMIGDLAAAARVSERTLRAAFQEYFGVGPVRYLRTRQLHLVHRTLRKADPDAASVTDILAQYGEWEFGRFAGRYRRLFGELPSDTLRTKGR